MNDPVMRILAWIVAVAVAIRVTIELIRPVLPYMAGLILLVAVAQLVSWYRGRW